MTLVDAEGSESMNEREEGGQGNVTRFVRFVDMSN